MLQYGFPSAGHQSERSSNTTKIETNGLAYVIGDARGQKEVLTQQRLKRSGLLCFIPLYVRSERSSNTTKIETSHMEWKPNGLYSQKEVLTQQRLKLKAVSKIGGGLGVRKKF